MQRFTLQGRQEVLTRISPEVAATAILRLDRGTCDPTAAGWTIFWQVLPDLELRAQCRPPQLEVAYEADGVAKYAPDFLISFAWLYLNALLREARQVNPSLTAIIVLFLGGLFYHEMSALRIRSNNHLLHLTGSQNPLQGLRLSIFL